MYAGGNGVGLLSDRRRPVRSLRQNASLTTALEAAQAEGSHRFVTRCRIRQIEFFAGVAYWVMLFAIRSIDGHPLEPSTTKALTMLRTTLITVALLLIIGRLATIAGPADAQDDAQDIAGVYAAEGSNGDGSLYRAIVVIEKHRAAFRMQWVFPTGASAVGLGILSGNVLAVSYYGASPGIVLYKVEGPKLVGEWTLFGGGGVLSKETLTRIPGDKIPESFHRETPQRETPPARHSSTQGSRPRPERRVAVTARLHSYCGLSSNVIVPNRKRSLQTK